MEVARVVLFPPRIQTHENATVNCDWQENRMARTCACKLLGKVLVGVGLAIKRESPYPIPMIHELAYDWIRYVPDRKGVHEGA